jgi:tetratricopeptide (TPR) repeat protein
VTRGVFWLALLLSGAPARAQNKPPEPPAVPPVVKEQEPPEEDPDLIPKEFSFNPLEASRNLTAGNFYFKKGNYRAASRRYSEATKWDPTSGEALLKLAEADEKLRDFAGAREAYTKYLAMPDAKDADAVKKKLAKLPQARTKK